MVECLIADKKPQPNELQDLGEGWTAYIRVVDALSKPLEVPDMTQECLIAAFLDKVKGWHARGEAQMGNHDGKCGKCGKYLNFSVYAPDIERK